MAQKRPITFFFLAGLNFLMALSFISCGVCANVSDGSKWFIEVNKVRWDDQKLNQRLKEKCPGYTPVKITGIVVGYGVCLGLILSGVALIFGGTLAKAFTLFVYAVGLLHHLISILYQFVWVKPAIDQFFNEIPPAIIVGQAATEVTRHTVLFPGWVSLAWWITGILFYLAGVLVVGLSFFLGSDEKSKKKDDEGDEDEEDEEEEDEDDRPQKKRGRK